MSSTSGWDRDNVKVKGVDSGGTDREIGAVDDGGGGETGRDPVLDASGKGTSALSFLSHI